MSKDVNEDFVDMLAAFNDGSVEFVVVGAYALAAHGYVRATEDIDLFVRPTKNNAQRVWDALLEFGAPVESHGITVAEFSSAGQVYQIGLPPRRIDILTSISGVSFDEAVAHAITSELGGQPARFIGREALLRNKRASARPKDLVDADTLEKSV